MNAPTHLAAVAEAEDTWTVAGRTFRSRLIVGTGKYKDYALNAAAAEAAGAEIVTVALRRVNLADPSQPRLVDYLDPQRFTYLPNTAGCTTGEEAVRALKLLVGEGFQCMVYCTDDLVFCRKLEDAGAVAIMPAGAPIGSGLGVQNRVNIRLIVEQAKVPVLVDAGVGAASDATIAMELGCDAVIVNTAIAQAQDPV